MMRCLFRLIVVGALLAGGAYVLGYRWDDSMERRARGAGAEAVDAAKALAGNIDRNQIREAGAGIATKIGEEADRAKTGLGDTRLTAKIKAKMALDDTLDGNRINVETQGTVVTLGGSVASVPQRQRAVQLARETEGVTSVVDRIEIRK
jgi:hyperosmotically inducible protein